MFTGGSDALQSHAEQVELLCKHVDAERRCAAAKQMHDMVCWGALRWTPMDMEHSGYGVATRPRAYCRASSSRQKSEQ